MCCYRLPSPFPWPGRGWTPCPVEGAPPWHMPSPWSVHALLGINDNNHNNNNNNNNNNNHYINNSNNNNNNNDNSKNNDNSNNQNAFQPGLGACGASLSSP